MKKILGNSGKIFWLKESQPCYNLWCPVLIAVTSHIAGGIVRDRAEHGGEAAAAVQRDGPPLVGRVRFQERHHQQEPHNKPQVIYDFAAVSGEIVSVILDF